MNDSAPMNVPPPRWSPRLAKALSGVADLATASVLLARHDVPVFPCAPGGKQPLTAHGFHDATADVAAVHEWWRRWPDANLGVPTGTASGVDVVDVDVHTMGSGFAAFERARGAGVANGWAWLVRTPSGGVHAYFLRRTAEVQRSWQVPSQHVDFRGDGGYIVAPPSRVTRASGQSRAYELIAIGQHQGGPVDSRQLREFLEPPRPTGPPAGMPAVGARPDKLAAWVASRPEGARNHGLFWAACRMVEDGHPFDTTASVLGEAAQAAGLPEREATTTVRSAYRIACRLGTAPGPTRPVEAVSL
ncbi:bifunctional DNA primase/polymerase [Nocardioides pocheonensis]|nr:bifunctional DNA primase/polymerase [Nocardioides pocheonensis]